MQSETSDRLGGKRVAIVGRFASLTQQDAVQLVRRFGGRPVRWPSRRTAMLVVGQEDWPGGRTATVCRAMARARGLLAAGYAMDVISEEEFLERLGLDGRAAIVQQYYTVAQLVRILGIPATQIRAWMRQGLIGPVRVIHRLAYFDFRHVAGVRKLLELVQAGVDLKRVRRMLARMQKWLPDVEQPLWQLAVLERYGRLLIRLDDGRLIEPGGQLQLEFRAMEADPSMSVHFEPQTADGWFEQAMVLEEAGRLADAAVAYRRAIDEDNCDPVLHFNLANVLYGLGDPQRAADEFLEATRLDPTYVEAWNNLGVALAEQGRGEEATLAFQRALQLLPAYTDAHDNLVEILHASGRENEAEQHRAAGRLPSPGSLR